MKKITTSIELTSHEIDFILGCLSNAQDNFKREGDNIDQRGLMIIFNIRGKCNAAIKKLEDTDETSAQAIT